MYREFVDTPIGLLMIEAEKRGIYAISPIFEKSFKESPSSLTALCKKQLSEYFCGKRSSFALPLRQVGTEFQQRVWQELSRVGFGQTRFYGEIAMAIGHPMAHRAVGSANKKNRLPIVVPCHRIVGKDNSLTGYALGLDCKSWLLKHEEKFKPL